MRLLKNIIYRIGVFALLICLSGCGVYSLSGASIDGKTINVVTFENKAPNVVPSLASELSNKIRDRILSQTGLTAVNSDEVDYVLKGTITRYQVSISGVQSNTAASQNRLTVTLQIDFVNHLNEEDNFNTSFSRFADFPASQPLQNVEAKLMEEIGKELADDIFNRAFVNW
ncbi:MAG TPA: LptE family protein [Chitinophagaceae bacterium]|nr:LptE family protein [Chitinophagaceae bacterium]